VESRGAVLFLNWVMALYAEIRGNPFAVPWSRTGAMDTPDGLADSDLAVELLAIAADTTMARYGSLDVPFGEVYRVRRDGMDLPANGMSDPAGVFRAAWYEPAGGGIHRLTGADSFVLAVEFSKPIRAVSVLGYGSASQAGSEHRTDQLGLFSEKRAREVWRVRNDVERNLEKRKVLEAQARD
jgi:acyl-homoserine-lactone acylase